MEVLVVWVCRYDEFCVHGMVDGTCRLQLPRAFATAIFE